MYVFRVAWFCNMLISMNFVRDGRVLIALVFVVFVFVALVLVLTRRVMVNRQGGQRWTVRVALGT